MTLSFAPVLADRWYHPWVDQLSAGTFFTPTAPEPLPDPELRHWNPAVAEMLGWPTPITAEEKSEVAQQLSGNRLPNGTYPIATVYAGHQFGHYVPQLGDGRALLLGTLSGADGQGWEVQLKGAGQTAYSRMGDGRAVLRSSLREYLASQAMAGLGIPTTLALSLVGSPQPVYRETVETAAVVTRVAESFLRFGHFEFFYYKGDREGLKQLLSYAVTRHFSQWAELPVEEQALALLEEVARRTGALVAQWQTVGFAHGVLNTDNMSLLGLTLDYGPYGMMEAFEPGYVCNHSDYSGRYAFNQQPAIGYWNVSRLGVALSPFLADVEREKAVDAYANAYTETFMARMREKLGLSETRPVEDEALIKGMFAWMARHGVDYTLAFRHLAAFDPADEGRGYVERMGQPALALEPWLDEYSARLLSEGRPAQERVTAMLAVNPKYVLRNYLAQLAIEEMQQGPSCRQTDRLMQVLANPFVEHPGMEDLAQPAPDWGKKLCISCSS